MERMEIRMKKNLTKLRSLTPKVHNMSDEHFDSNGNFRMKVAEWRGYVFKALEEIEEDHHEIQRKVDNLGTCIANNKAEIDLTIYKLKRRVDKIYVKVVALGTSIGILVGILFKLLLDKVA